MEIHKHTSMELKKINIPHIPQRLHIFEWSAIDNDDSNDLKVGRDLLGHSFYAT